MKKKGKKLTRYMVRYIPLYILAVSGMLAATGLEAYSPRLTQRIIEEGISPAGLTTDERIAIILPILSMILGLAVVRALAGYIKEYVSDCIGVKIGRDMRRDLFSHVTDLSMSYFGKTNTGELMARTKDDIEKVWFVMGFAGVLALQCIVHSVTMVACMVSYSPLLSIIPVAGMATVCCVALKMEKKLDEGFGKRSETNAELTTVAQENLAGVRTVKAFSRERFEMEKFRKKNRKYYDDSISIAKVFSTYYPVITVTGGLLTVLVTAAGAVLVLAEKGEINIGFLEKFAGHMTVSKLVAFIQYSTGIIWPMECLGWLSNCIAGAMASGKKIKAIFDEEPEIKEPEEPVELTDMKGELVFDHVSFKPGGKTVLEDVSFSIPNGKTLGLMGMTGSGKSAVINLAERFYDVTDGSITLDGVDIRKLPLKTVRRSMAVVMQDVFLFSDSIAENIKLGSDGKLTQEELEAAAREAGAAEFIEKLPEKYETIIGERGVGLSGGQKQRISIARALSKHAPILVLDDATSALDMETEYEIQQSLDKLGGCSKLIVAHRVSAVKDADEIIFLDNGRIAERGTHSELMKKRGLYFDTYVAQYNTEEDLVERSER